MASGWQIFSTDDGLPHNDVVSLLEAPDGTFGSGQASSMMEAQFSLNTKVTTGSYGKRWAKSRDWQAEKLVRSM